MEGRGREEGRGMKEGRGVEEGRGQYRGGVVDSLVCQQWLSSAHHS